jgi:hypothetical protein
MTGFGKYVPIPTAFSPPVLRKIALRPALQRFDFACVGLMRWPRIHLSALRVVDHEGADLPDLEAARQEAIRTARELAENRAD